MADTLTPLIAALKDNPAALAKLAQALAGDTDIVPVIDSAIVGVTQARATIEDLFLDPAKKPLLDEFEAKVLGDPARRVDLETKLLPNIGEFVGTVFTRGAAADKAALLGAIVANPDALTGITALLTAGAGVASLATTIATDPAARKSMIDGLRDDPHSAAEVVSEMFDKSTPRNALKVTFRDVTAFRTEMITALMADDTARDALAVAAANDPDTRAAILKIINGTPALLKDEILDLIDPTIRDAVFTAILGDPATRKAFLAVAAIDTTDTAMTDTAAAAIAAGAIAVTPLIKRLVTDGDVLDTFALTLSSSPHPGPIDHFVNQSVNDITTMPLAVALKARIAALGI